MAPVTSWGMACALLELGHIRIARTGPQMRMAFDLSAMVTLAALSLIMRKRGSETEPFIGAFAEQDRRQ